MMRYATPGLSIGGFVKPSGGKSVVKTPANSYGLIASVSSVPSEPDHVANETARRSIDPSGKTAGYQVIQDDNSVTYEFLGDGLDEDAGLWMSGAGHSSWDGPYEWAEKYIRIDGGEGQVSSGGGGTWTAGSEYAISHPQDFPWEDAWEVAGGGPPAPSVTRNPIVNLVNWTSL